MPRGSQVNTVVTLSEAMTRELLRHHEVIWKAAEQLTATPSAAEPEAAGA